MESGHGSAAEGAPPDAEAKPKRTRGQRGGNPNRPFMQRYRAAKAHQQTMAQWSMWTGSAKV
eukprot:1583979-Karenia_brevis.AAC.1